MTIYEIIIKEKMKKAGIEIRNPDGTLFGYCHYRNGRFFSLDNNDLGNIETGKYVLEKEYLKVWKL